MKGMLVGSAFLGILGQGCVTSALWSRDTVETVSTWEAPLRQIYSAPRQGDDMQEVALTFAFEPMPATDASEEARRMFGLKTGHVAVRTPQYWAQHVARALQISGATSETSRGEHCNLEVYIEAIVWKGANDPAKKTLTEILWVSWEIRRKDRLGESHDSKDPPSARMKTPVLDPVRRENVKGHQALLPAGTSPGRIIFTLRRNNLEHVVPTPLRILFTPFTVVLDVSLPLAAIAGILVGSFALAL